MLPVPRPELAIEADRFRVTFQGNQSLDAGILVRDYVRAFRVTGTKAYTEFGSLQDCGPSRSQIWLDIDPAPHPNTLPRELYFIVQRRGEDFRMVRIDVGEGEPPCAQSHGRSSADPRRRASVRRAEAPSAGPPRYSLPERPGRAGPHGSKADS